jgi:methyltransferase-like protein
VANAAPASTYDELPYLNKAFPQTHPDRLATLGRLFGLEPPDLASCRVLELGCASGDNVIPMAMGLPNARFVGIDLSKRQIEQGQRMVSALGLENVELRQYDIADIDSSWGKFDYIISHGIYSWIPAPVRERLLAVCNENLTTNGIAYVSYNTLPGWHMRGMIRDMMIYHSRGFDGASAKVAQARGLLDFLARSAPENTPYGMRLREEADSIRKEADAYLFHEHLEENNQAFYFHEFADDAARHGLAFLAEADLTDMLVSKFPAEVAQTLQRVATDIIRMEQYMDFVRNRQFRQTLLVHRGAPIQRNIDGRLLPGMLVTSAARPDSERPVLAQGASETFVSPNGAKQMILDALSKAALVVMAEQWPRCFDFEELYRLSRARLREEIGDAPVENDDLKSFGDRMLQGYAARVIELRVTAPRLAFSISERPVASPLARYQLANGATTVTNLRHEAVELPELPRRILMLLDGTRDTEAVATDIVKLGRAGTIGIREQEGGPAVTDPARLEALLRALVADNLPKLVRVGLLLQ